MMEERTYEGAGTANAAIERGPDRRIGDAEEIRRSPGVVTNKPGFKSFSWALEALKQGDRVRRTGWNGKGMFLFLVPGSTFEVNRQPLMAILGPGTTVNYHPHIDMMTAQGYVVPWLASQSDLLQDDWEIV